MLLGMYRCTDVPGEFVWQPGTLTQAATKGHWILLEDIDYAPLDVVRHLLNPLLYTSCLWRTFYPQCLGMVWCFTRYVVGSSSIVICLI